MEIIYTKDYQELSQKAAQQIIKIIQENPEGLYCFAGGDTPVRTIEYLVAAHEKHEIDLTKAYFIELDEWVGLDHLDAGSCSYYMKKNLLSKVPIETSHYYMFDTKNMQLEEECRKAKAFINKHHGITLSLLGVGVNGHIGFNEPGTTSIMETRVVSLDEVTTQVGQKYFSVEQKITQGITLGMQELLASEYIIVLANGATKRKAIEKLHAKIKMVEWPITLFIDHPSLTVIVDEATK